MKRVIYIGKPWGQIQYGMTGQVTDVRWSNVTKFCFHPDGNESVRYWADRPQLYIPSEDQKRHCTKP